MTLEELILILNNSTAVELYSEEAGEPIETYSSPDEIPEEYLECNVTDVFATVTVKKSSYGDYWPCIGIEIETE